MNLSIRPATEEDAESIVGLLNPIIAAEKYTIVSEPISVVEQIDWIRSVSECGLFHVAVGTNDRKVLGFQSVEPLSATEKAWKHVGDVATFVALDSHRQGVGRSLSQMTFERAREHGFLKINATIRADNPQGVAFYKSMGFDVIGTARKHALVRGEYIDEILAEKFIG